MRGTHLQFIMSFLLICSFSEHSTLKRSAMAMEHTPAVPAELNLNKVVLSKSGTYKVEYKVIGDTVPFEKLHDWLLSIADKAGAPVEGAQLEITAFMPAHQHGAKTTPKMTRHFGKGKHLIEGMYFNMTGWWVVRITIKRGDLTDQAEFNIAIK